MCDLFHLSAYPTADRRGMNIIILKETFQESECLCGTFKKASYR